MASTDRVKTAPAGSRTREADPAERELLERLRAGQPDAYAEFVRAFEAPVYRAALAALGSPADAEEAAQDAFVSAFRTIAAFRGESSLKTWIVAIAWRKALTRRRKLQWLRLRTVTPWAEGEADPLDAAVDSGADPQVSALGVELRTQLRALVRALPGKLRDPLLLVAGGDNSYDEAAAILGIPVGTAKWRVSEARRQLREKLRHLGYER